MAAAIKALNAKIRSNKVTDYFCSTHFWGPASNFGIPIAAVMDITGKDPELISGNMTASLVVYSAVFMRYSMAVTPKNYLLFGCHFVNECAQLAQGYRYFQWNHNGGREKALAEKGTPAVVQKAVDAAGAAAAKVQEVAK
ncbi:hypothetical protein EDC01DRAFT_715962 [Geopyxis carbonaria]|nr:hypothetical protein EDC01DRAFT_715962 [Geopyxis carbonaria]